MAQFQSNLLVAGIGAIDADAGNVLTWFASNDQDYVPGARVTIDGTVKKHSDYQGVRETALSRVKVTMGAA
jgi:hypothetical protein